MKEEQTENKGMKSSIWKWIFTILSGVIIGLIVLHYEHSFLLPNNQENERNRIKIQPDNQKEENLTNSRTCEFSQSPDEFVIEFYEWYQSYSWDGEPSIELNNHPLKKKYLHEAFIRLLDYLELEEINYDPVLISQDGTKIGKRIAYTERMTSDSSKAVVITSDYCCDEKEDFIYLDYRLRIFLVSEECQWKIFYVNLREDEWNLFNEKEYDDYLKRVGLK